MKSSRDDSPPSSITIGLLTVENILRQNAEPIDIKSNTEYLLAILELFDLDCLKEIMTISFQILQDPSSSTAHKDAVKAYISSISLHFQKSFKFGSQIVSFFDSLQNLPVNLLQDFPLSSSIILTALSCHSRFNIAKLFFSSKILPKANEETFKEIDESILYDMSQLNLKNFSFDKIHLTQPYFYRIHQVAPVTNIVIEKDDSINPSLYDVVVESDSRTLTKIPQLKRLFDFFSGFDSKHAAAFILAVSFQNMSFRDILARIEEAQRERIIEIFREYFLDRGVDLESIPASIDLPYVKSIDPDGCSNVFTILHGLLKNKPINGHVFVTEWKNEPLQIQFLTYISINNISDFVFDDCRMAKLNGFEPPEIPNKCWLCIDFVERILKLSEKYPDKVKSILSSASAKFSSVVLLTYSHIYPNNSDIFHESSSENFKLIIQNHNSSGILQPLWSISPEFCQELFINYYNQNPTKLGNIIDCIQDHLDDVLKCNDINFVLDLAFQSSLRGLISFSSFLGTLPERFSPSAYDTALNFVKSMILDSSISSPVLLREPLNALFQYFWGIFDTLPDETKLLVNTVYSICQSFNINLHQFAFAEKLPTITTPDVKGATIDYFNKFFSNEITVEQFVQIFHQLRGTSPPFFQSMISYLLQEIRNLEEKDVYNRLGELIGNMIHENLFTEEEMKHIFNCFVQGFSTKSKLTQFSISALEICYNKLRKQPEYVFSLLKQPLLRGYSLYEKIRKISANMSVPLNLSMPTTLPLHPNLKRFEKLPAPLPRLWMLIQQIPNDSNVIKSIITFKGSHIDWAAIHLVSTIQDHPKFLEQVLPAIRGSPPFSKIVIQAAIFESIQLITSPQFTTLEGAFARRRLTILGKLLGQLTLAHNRMLPGRYLDLKQLLLFAFSQGKLLGVVPFVAEILCVASSYFSPPNPYMSGLLQVLASIGLTDLLKLSIKNDVFRVLRHFEVSPCQLHLVELVPDVRQGNFDFIAPPFALSYVLSPPDIDLAVQLDDNVFNLLASQSIIIPEPKKNNQIIPVNVKRDMMQRAITSATIAFLKSEGKMLVKVAASTASALIKKDFAICNNVDLMMETASVLTKQLSSGLTLVTAIQKLHRSICHQVQNEFQPEDSEWINECVQVNSPWISQMLQEIVHIRAIKLVQIEIETNRSGQNYYDNANQSHKALPPGFSLTENGLTPEQRQIYEDLAELPLNPAEIPTPETSDKSIRSSENFEKFFVKMTKFIQTFPNSQDAFVDESAFSVVMSDCPEIGPDFESFLSTIKTMMKFMVKLTHSINDRIYGTLLKRFVSSVPKAFVIKAQPYVIKWLRNSIPSITLIVSMIQNELITTQQLDQFFFNSLNKQPFNYRLFVFAIKFLDFTLIQSKSIKPADMILSLTLVVSTPLSMLESSSQQQQNSMNELKKVLDELEIPLIILPRPPRPTSIPIFDPLEEINDSESIVSLLNLWQELIDYEAENDGTGIKDYENKLFELTTKCCNRKRDFFSILIYKGQPKYLAKMIQTLRKMNILEQNWESIASAYVFLIKSTAMVLGYDMSSYFNSLIALIIAISDDFKMTILFADLLHELRPLKMPSFTFAWIQIASERHFVSSLLSKTDGWDKMATICSDFTASLVYASDMNVRDVFDRLYKSILRFILVLDHDFPDFLVSFAPEFVSIVPTQFVQLHNIILHGIPSTMQIQPFEPKNLLKTPGIEDFQKMPQPSKNLIEKCKFDEVIKSTAKSTSNLNQNAFFEQFKRELENKLSHVLMSAFVVYATNSLLPNISIQQIMSADFESLQLNKIICDIARSLRPNAAMLFLNAIVDMVRYPCRSTLFYMKTSLMLLRTPASKNGELQCDELLVRIILERASTPPPYPWGLKILVRMMLEDSKLAIFEKPYIKGNQACTKFLKKIDQSFSNDKSV